MGVDGDDAFVPDGFEKLTELEAVEALAARSRDGDDDAAGSLFIDDVNKVLEDVHSTLKKNKYYIGDMLKHLKENNYYVEHWGWW